MKIHCFFSLLLICLASNFALSQTTPVFPKSFNSKVPSPAALLKMPDVNNQIELAQALENEAAGFDKMLRFGKELETQVLFSKKADVFVYPNGNVLRRLIIESPSALSINLILAEFHLSENALLHLVNPITGDYIGAYTSFNNNEAKMLGTELLKGDKIVLEVFEPKEEAYQSDFLIETVVHAFRGLDVLATESLNSSGDCNVDVNCPEGQGWELQRNSVAMMVNGGGFCTGSLVHNTTGSIIPYFLTARHCGLNPSSWVFRFRWEAPAGQTSCATTSPSGDGPQTMNVNGGVRRAENGTSDFLLVELSTAPSPTWGVYYNGWDRSDGAIVANGMGIHHPDGDIKKLAIENQPLTQATINFNGAQNRTWRIADWDVGVTEPGSSGSPLFDPNQRVIGVLSGGTAACSGTDDNGAPDYYGRFGYAWDNGPDSSKRLRDWLDPGNTGVITLDGVDPAVGNSARDASVGGLEGIDGTTCEDQANVSFTLMNAGTDNLVSCEYRYGNDLQTWTNATFTGNLAQFETTVINLTVSPEIEAHTFYVEVVSVNTMSDQNPSNNQVSSDYFKMNHDTDINLLLQIDCFGSETTWEITNDENVTLYEGGPYPDENNPAPIDQDFCVQTGCYSFKLYDEYGDGMTGCNPNQGGNGSYQLTNANSGLLYAELKEEDADFGSSLIRNFCVDFAGLRSNSKTGSTLIFPNPGNNSFEIKTAGETGNIQVRAISADGKTIASFESDSENTKVNTSTWSDGVYLIQVTQNNKTEVLRWVKQ